MMRAAVAFSASPHRPGPVSPPIPRPDPARWPLRGAIRLGLLGLILLVAGLGSWAGFARLVGAVIAPGHIEVESRRQTVQHPDGGVVAATLVREGDSVAEGQLLLRLDASLHLGELALIETQYLDASARDARLEAEATDQDRIRFPNALVSAATNNPEVAAILAAQANLFATRREALTQSLAQLSRQGDQIAARIDGLDAQSAAITIQRALIGRELADTRTLLDKGLAHAPRVLALEREAARLDGQLRELAASHAEALARQAELTILRQREITGQRNEAQSEQATLATHMRELAGRRAELILRIARLEVRAPAAGIVHQLIATTPRAVLRAGEPMLAIVPQDQPLVVVARIAPADIDRTSIEQEVSLRFSAVSARNMPEIFGVLTMIAPDTVSDPGTGAIYYRAEITIPETERAKLAPHRLVPGMPVEVFIRTGEQSPLRYLLRPFGDYLSRAMREG